MFESRQHDLLARLFNLAGKEDFIQDGVDLAQSPNQYSLDTNLPAPFHLITHPITHLVKVENKIQLAHIPKELIQHLDEEMNSLQVCELIVVSVHANAEEQPSVSAVHDLSAAAELDKIRLILLISGGNEAMHLVIVG